MTKAINRPEVSNPTVFWATDVSRLQGQMLPWVFHLEGYFVHPVAAYNI